MKVLNFHRGMNINFWLGILHGVPDKFSNDVLGAAVVLIFTGH
jgi:hypothetical protein